VVIAEDAVLLRAGIARVLEDAGFEIAGEAGDADELLRLVRELEPDVAVVDIRMPPTHVDEGLKAAHAIRGELPGVGVLMLSQYVDERYVVPLLQDGTSGVGYLLKDRVADGAGFADAVRRVASGGTALDPEVVSHLLAPSEPDGPLTKLTPKESEVLGHMAEGLSNGAIARALAITERGVERHVTAIFEKLDLPTDSARHRRVLAVLRFLQDA
jgi:DNA-binding NarL/FixJ family response regulator